MTKEQNQSLEGKVAIVTGSSRGIGKAIAITLANEGAKVLVTGLEMEETKQTASEITEKTGAEINYFVGDLSVESNVSELVEQTISSWGKIDILVNNAGGGVILPFLEHTAESFQQTLDRNLWTTIWPCHKALPHMIKQNYGRIINIGADSVRNGLWEHAGYNAAKGGVHGLTTGLAREFAMYNITINTIAPSTVESEPLEAVRRKDPEMAEKYIGLIPKGRGVYEEEIADAVWFLASEKAKFITGQVISINGGSTML